MKAKMIGIRIGINLAAWLLPIWWMSLSAASFKKFTFWEYFTLDCMIGLILVPPIYFNNLYLIPRFLSRRKYGLYLITLLLTLFAYTPAAVFLIEQLARRANGMIVLSHSAYLVNVLGLGVFVLCTTIIKLASNWFWQQSRIQKLESQQLRSELTALRNQLNPHFLFNTLNSLYALTLTQSQLAPQVVLKLSQIMRYVVYDCERDFVLLSKEIKYIEDYVDLQKIRCGQRSRIEMMQEGETDTLRIPPLILITFVENAFKHGVHNEYEDTFVSIHIGVTRDVLTFYIINSLLDTTPATTGGVGLKNVRQRLDLIYPQKYILTTDGQERTYRVNLTVQLDAYENKVFDRG